MASVAAFGSPASRAERGQPAVGRLAVHESRPGLAYGTHDTNRAGLRFLGSSARRVGFRIPAAEPPAHTSDGACSGRNNPLDSLSN